MRSIIFYNLYESIYTVRYKDIEFKFSSALYMRKFENRVTEYVEINMKKFYSRFRWVAGADFVNNLRYTFAVDLYTRIEKRGFLIKQVGDNNETFTERISAITGGNKAV